MTELAISINQILGFSTATSALLSILISALWAIYFNRIKEGQRAEFQKQIEEQKVEFNKQLENIKAKNEKMNYITKTQFDAEFKMYQELSEPIFEMFSDVIKLFPVGIDFVPEDPKERKDFYEKRYNKAMHNLLIFQKKLYAYAPFIPQKIYDMYNDFRTEAGKQVNWYPNFVLHPDSSLIKDLRSESLECWERTEKLIDKYDKIIQKLRDYLQSLKVQEDLNEQNC